MLILSVKSMSFVPTGKKNDEYMTRKYTWDAIKHLIPADKVLWEAFNGNGQSAMYLRELGFPVVAEDVDFFTSDKGDLVVTNPPWSMKDKVFRRLIELDKPFILLVPTCRLHTQYFQNLFRQHPGLQLIFPSFLNHFDRYNEKGECETAGRTCPVYTSYICWKIGLPSDITFVDANLPF